MHFWYDICHTSLSFLLLQKNVYFERSFWFYIHSEYLRTQKMQISDVNQISSQQKLELKSFQIRIRIKYHHFLTYKGHDHDAQEHSECITHQVHQHNGHQRDAWNKGWIKDTEWNNDNEVNRGQCIKIKSFRGQTKINLGINYLPI